MIRRLLRFGGEPDDIQPRDFVRKYGFKGVGCVESITGDHALVDWLDGTKEVTPLNLLKPVKQRGGYFDTRKGGG